MEHFYAYQAGGTQNYLILDVLGPLLLTLLVFLHQLPSLTCIPSASLHCKDTFISTCLQVELQVL